MGLNCIVMRTAQHVSVLHCMVLPYTTWFCTVWYFSILHGTALHGTALHRLALLHCMLLDCLYTCVPGWSLHQLPPSQTADEVRRHWGQTWDKQATIASHSFPAIILKVSVHLLFRLILLVWSVVCSVRCQILPFILPAIYTTSWTIAGYYNRHWLRDLQINYWKFTNVHKFLLCM